MKPYPRYKPTGLAWLPSVPEHWEVVKLRNLVKHPLQYGANASGLFYDSEKPRYIRITDIDENGTLKTSGMQSLSWDDAQPYMLADGDVLFARSGATAGKTFLFHASFGNCCFAGYLIRCKPNRNRIASEYLSYYSLSNSYKNWLGRSTIQATIQNVSAEKYKEMPLPLPPPSEQECIVRYLDEKTAAIDELVRAKERQIELLRERKQALVSAAVTGGLDPATERKDSGVSWIGKIPKGWKVCRLKDIVRSNLESLGEATESDKQIKYLDISAVGNGYLREKPVCMVFAEAPSRARRIVHEGDTIISTVRTYLKSVLYIDQSVSDCIVSTGFSVLTPKTEIEPRYLGFLLSSNWFVDSVIAQSIGISYPAINDSSLLALSVVFPPLPEQQRIVAHLDSVCSELDVAEAAIRKQIALLQELRTRLVSDAVTGAVEV